jgi:arginine decarboxylase
MVQMDAPQRRGQIPVVSGLGSGSTLLSSFDAALHACGVCNYNLIPLSSVIPPDTEIVPATRLTSPPEDHGRRLYVVKADARSDRPGDVVAAGIGWYQWGDGRGVFVEHEIVGRDRQAVADDLNGLICHSLGDLCAARDIPFLPGQMRSQVAVGDVGDRPTCALVIAVYQAEGWTEGR